MNKEKKAIVIGEYSRVEYHPLKGVDHELTDMLSDFKLEFTEDYNRFKTDSLKKCDLLISYVDHWKEKLTDEQTTGLLSYVCSGGGFLILHNGIAIQSRYELAQLAGARFTSHPDQEVLSYRVKAPEHIILEGIDSFEIKEEPYQFEFDVFTEKTLLLTYECGGKQWPAAWAHGYGSGRVVFLSPGHQRDSFLNPMYRKLIQRSALWAVGLL